MTKFVRSKVLVLFSTAYFNGINILFNKLLCLKVGLYRVFRTGHFFQIMNW
jgi:hypothetical protein